MTVRLDEAEESAPWRCEPPKNEHGPHCPDPDYRCVCGLFDVRHVLFCLEEALRFLSGERGADEAA